MSKLNELLDEIIIVLTSNPFVTQTQIQLVVQQVLVLDHVR